MEPTGNSAAFILPSTSTTVIEFPPKLGTYNHFEFTLKVSVRGSRPTWISLSISSRGKDTRLTEPESGFTAASQAPSGEMAIAEAETPAPLNAMDVAGSASTFSTLVGWGRDSCRGGRGSC